MTATEAGTLCMRCHVDEWDVLKAHARAQCVTVKDRLWCEMALALVRQPSRALRLALCRVGGCIDGREREA